MIMTNQPSIQEVLFFPQMRPEKQVKIASDEEFMERGVRAELIPILHKLGVQTLQDLDAKNPNKLFNDVCGTRKKLKLVDVQNPSLDEVQGWIQG
jgi:lysyl-tRNA synthetase class 2